MGSNPGVPRVPGGGRASGGPAASADRRAGEGGWLEACRPGSGLRLTAVFVVYLSLLVDVGSNSKPGVVEEVCQWQAFEPTCAKDEVVVMERAHYGRMRIGQCVTEDLGYLGCKVDVLRMADRKCSGRRSCAIKVPDEDFELQRPCSERQNYLEVAYKCVKVQGTERRQCGTCDFVKLTAPSGSIASATTEETGCGSADCPWLIEAQPGQQIRVRLFDFGSPTKAPDTLGNVNVCRVYAVLKEESTRRSVTLCGGQQREKDAYTTSSNTLEVRILGKSNNAERMYFLLQYSALGCADLAPPAGGWFKRHGDSAIVGCSGSDDTWRLTCNGTHWIGIHGECPEDARRAASLVKANFSFEISIAIVVIIAVFVGSVILVVGLVCFRRHNTPNNQTRRSSRMPEEALYHQRAGRYPQVPQYMEAPEETDADTLKSASSRAKTYTDVRNEYAHIWEMPLPPPQSPHPPPPPRPGVGMTTATGEVSSGRQPLHAPPPPPPPPLPVGSAQMPMPPEV